MCTTRSHSSFFRALAWSGVALFSGLLPGTNSWAVYDQYVTWSDMSSLDIRPALESSYASDMNLYFPSIPDAAHELVLRDADNLINPDFHIPTEIRPTVAFWLRIYTEFSTQQVVLFDSKHPEIIYDVLDFRELAKGSRNRMVYEIVRDRQVTNAVKKLKVAFQSLIKNPKKKKFTSEELKIKTALRKSFHKHPLSEFCRSIRAQTGQRDNIVKGLLAAETFFPQMDAIFKKHGLPTELNRLVLVESSFDLSAKSRVGAAGIWQFMPPSGREFMKVDEAAKVDERLSPLKATVGASYLLNRGYRMFGNWPLAVVSYNHGLNLPRNFRHKESFPKMYKMFADCKNKKLGWASRNYYSEFLAIVHAEAYRHLFYGTPPTSSLRPTAYYRVERPQTAVEIALSKGVPLQEFRFRNPDILDIRKKLPVGFLVAVPSSDRSTFAENNDKLIRVLQDHVKPRRVRRI